LSFPFTPLWLYLLSSGGFLIFCRKSYRPSPLERLVIASFSVPAFLLWHCLFYLMCLVSSPHGWPRCLSTGGWGSRGVRHGLRVFWTLLPSYLLFGFSLRGVVFMEILILETLFSFLHSAAVPFSSHVCLVVCPFVTPLTSSRSCPNEFHRFLSSPNFFIFRNISSCFFSPFCLAIFPLPLCRLFRVSAFELTSLFFPFYFPRFFVVFETWMDLPRNFISSRFNL